MSQSVRKTSKKCHQVAKVCYGLSWKWVGCCHDKRWAIITFWWKISTLALLANNRSILTFYSGDIVFQMKISVSCSQFCPRLIVLSRKMKPKLLIYSINTFSIVNCFTVFLNLLDENVLGLMFCLVSQVGVWVLGYWRTISCFVSYKILMLE